MAQAWTADDFGSNESKVIVAAPVIAETEHAALYGEWRYLASDAGYH
ncbi:hypothetical protein ACLB1M_19930 [Escherichia coli]